MLELLKQYVEWDTKQCYKRGLKRAIRKANNHIWDVDRTEYNKWVNVACCYAARLGLKSIKIKKRYLP